MSHEFQVHHLVSQLIALLNVRQSGDVDGHVAVLLQNRTPYVTTQVSAHTAKKKIAEFSPSGEEFLKSYDALKVKQARNLDPLVYLLSKITENEGLRVFLKRSRPAVVAPPPSSRPADDVTVLDVVEGLEVELPAKGAKLTRQELGQLMGQLESVTHTLQAKGKKKPQTVEGKFPFLPAWLMDRRYLHMDYVSDSVPAVSCLGSIPVASQQRVVIEDLLFVMAGVDGQYIRAAPIEDETSAREFIVDLTLDVSIKILVNRILPICSHFSTVTRFLDSHSHFSHGMINQALCAAMQSLLKEYLVIVAQLEHQFNTGQLTLQKLWYYIQPCKQTLEVLNRISVSLSQGSCRGGKTLTNLHRLTCRSIGQAQLQELCLHLTQAACKPYFLMLQRWVYEGVIADPYQEFMITEHEMIQKDRLHQEYNDSYWERRYTVCQEHIPSFLEHMAEQILSTGKYLNVIRECQQEVAPANATDISYTVEEMRYVKQIEQAYKYASQQLLDLIMHKEDLLGYLRSIKHYFLLDQGDLFVHFMDLAQDELYKPMADILPARLQTLLELAVRTSLADHDPYKDNIQPLLLPYDLTTQLLYIMAIQPEDVGPHSAPPPAVLHPDPAQSSLSGLEAFSLDYSVKWPLSLVISRKALVKYQMLFRHFFHCKHVERQLCASWSKLQAARKICLHQHPWYSSAFALLQRMLNFIQNLQYYMVFEVVEPNSASLQHSLPKATTIDDVLASHSDFLDKCLRDCMLSNREVLRVISRLTALSLSFTSQLQQANGEETARPLPPPLRSPSKTLSRLLSVSELEPGSMAETVEQCDASFTRDVVLLLEKLNTLEVESVGGIAARLNFNGFYQTESEDAL